MSTSIVTFRNEFTEGVLNFVWRQWCRMGVAGSVGQKDPWVVDPEPLLALTTEVARRDARMFDEVMDWLAVNGRWINVQRLSAVMRQDHMGDKAVMGAVASWMTGHDTSMKWRGLAQRSVHDARKPEEPLFRTPAGNAPRGAAHADPHFRRYGLIRETMQTRGMSRAVNMKDPANVMFKSRAVFGIGIRADVMAYLVTTGGAHARGMARILGYNPMRVNEVLLGLAEAGVASVHPVGRTRQYGINHDAWRAILVSQPTSAARWVNWRALTRGLTAIWREAWALDEARADEYVFSSKMRAAMQSARNDLRGSGMGFAIEDDRGHVAEAYLPVFMRDTSGILKILAE